MKQTTQSKLIKGIVYSVTSLVGLTILALLIYIIVLGLPNIKLNLFEKEYNSDNVSLFPAMINTLIVTFVTLLFTIPIGVGSAIYLNEYAKAGNKFVKIIRITAETLSGIPSIVYGLFGFLLFVTTLKWQFSLLAGCCTLSIMILPVIIRTSEEALMDVPKSFREASYALGSGKLRTVFKIVLPSASYGIINGIVLSIGRIIGETAALIYTAGTVAHIPKSLMGSGRTLSVHLYQLWCEGLATKQAYATALILLIVVFLLNGLSELLRKLIFKKI